MNNAPVMSDAHVKDLAEKIAMLITVQNEPGGFDKLQKSVEEIRSRLERLELGVTGMNETVLTHPSQDRFQIAEAGVDSPNDGISAEKTCPYEPSAKPCDHCSMCSSRGF